jgi:hypothetical protein
MRPPFCAFCGAMKPGARLARFADYAPLPDGIVGHPNGLEWFCDAHAARAEALQHLPFDEALARMRRRRWWTRWLPLGM